LTVIGVHVQPKLVMSNKLEQLSSTAVALGRCLEVRQIEQHSHLQSVS